MTASSPRGEHNAKGLVYVGARTFYAERIPGGIAAVDGALESDAARGFLQQHFIPGAWYDVEPLQALNAAAGRVARVSPFQLIRESARWQAHRDIHGVYRMLLRLATPDLVVTRLPRAAVQYFDFGVVSGEWASPGVYRAEARGIPAHLRLWFNAAIEGFAPVALETAGAKDVEVRALAPAAEATPATMTLRYEFRWSR